MLGPDLILLKPQGNLPFSNCVLRLFKTIREGGARKLI